jgi:hypothetical protein
MLAKFDKLTNRVPHFIALRRIGKMKEHPETEVHDRRSYEVTGGWERVSLAPETKIVGRIDKQLSYRFIGRARGARSWLKHRMVHPIEKCLTVSGLEVVQNSKERV